MINQRVSEMGYQGRYPRPNWSLVVHMQTHACRCLLPALREALDNQVSLYHCLFLSLQTSGGYETLWWYHLSGSSALFVLLILQPCFVESIRKEINR